MATTHTTNYRDTFLTVAPDTRAVAGVEPPLSGTGPSVARLTFEMIAEHPYVHTSDEVIFTVYAERAGIPELERPAARAEYFSKGRPCLRSSALGKTYGWGVHSDADCRVALYALGTPEYERLASGIAPEGTEVAVKPAMRSSR